QGELDAALVGAVDFCGDPRTVSFMGTSPVGEGAVAMVLKRLSDARRDGDRIYATVRGIGAAARAADAVQRAHGEAGLDPSRATYLEAGTAVLSAFSQGDLPCALGRLTPTLGWCGAVTGLASLLRATGCLHYRVLPATSEAWPGAEGRLHAPREMLHWFHDRIEGPRTAAVCCETADGNALHVVLEEEPDCLPEPLFERPAGLFCLQPDQIADLQRFAREHPDGVEALARKWHRSGGRGPLAVVARTREGLQQSLEQALAHPGVAFRGQHGLFYSPEPLGSGQLAFVYPGSGNHFLGMGRQLALYWPRQALELHRRTERLASHLMVRYYAPYRLDWSPGWEVEARKAIAEDAHRMIFGQVAFGVLASQVALALGLDPAAVIGYSLGESAGLFSLGAWPDRDEMYRRIDRSDLFRTRLAGACLAAREAFGLDPFDWKVVVVNRPATTLREALVEPARLLLINTDEECVLGGPAGAVEETVRRLGCEAFALEGVPTVHCEAARPVEGEYFDLHVLPVQPVRARFYSGCWGRAYELTSQNAARSILDQALHGLDFPAVVRQAHQDGVRCFLEIGPQGSCTRMISQILADRPHLARAFSGEDEVGSVLRAMAAMLAEGVPGVSLDGLYGGSETAP
ncbi:MAG: type I polyketide synthase, partial [Candidatus Eremiobacterota bacterium]